MSENKKISVVIPVYNVEKYLKDCFESIVHQSIGFNNIEVIVVDDSSTDGSWKIICEYGEKYKNIKTIKLNHNTGSAGKPRNIGIKYVTGDYLIFLDPDDILPLNAYKNLYDNALKYNSDFVMGKMKAFKDDNKYEFEHETFRNYKLQKKYINTSIDESKFFLQVKTGHVLKLVKSSLIVKNNIRFDENLKNGEDKLYDIKLYKISKKFTYVPECVYKYRVRSDENNKSMTQQDALKSIYNDISITKIIKKELNIYEFNYFQINAYRSIFWRMLQEDFDDISYEDKLQLIKDLKEITIRYDEKIFKQYFNLELPILSLIVKEKPEKALIYIKSLIERRSLYKKSLEYKKIYKEIVSIRHSVSWKITNPLRKYKYEIKLFLKKI